MACLPMADWYVLRGDYKIKMINKCACLIVIGKGNDAAAHAQNHAGVNFAVGPTSQVLVSRRLLPARFRVAKINLES